MYAKVLFLQSHENIRVYIFKGHWIDTLSEWIIVWMNEWKKEWICDGNAEHGNDDDDNGDNDMMLAVKKTFCAT